MAYKEHLTAFIEQENVKVKLIEDEKRDLSLLVKSTLRETSTKIPVANFKIYSRIPLLIEHQAGYDSKVNDIKKILGYRPAHSTRGGILRYFAPEGNLELFDDTILQSRMSINICNRIMNILKGIDHRLSEEGVLTVEQVGISEFDPEMVKVYQDQISSNPKYR